MNSLTESESDSQELFPRHSTLNKSITKQENSQFDILRPLTKDANTYKKEDLIKVHEFKRENIREQFEDINNDYFRFTDENDPKYNFLKVQYLLRSKLLIRSIKWSCGIGLAFFAHRYYRKQLFWPALRWGGITWTLSMLFIWASLEFQPHLMSIFHSQFIKDLSFKDQQKYKTIGNMQQEEYWSNLYKDQYGVQLVYSQNTNCEIAKLAYDYDSQSLKSFNYSPLKTEKITKKIELNEENMFSEDFDDRELLKASLNQEEFQYDFSFHKSQPRRENCFVNTAKFFELEMGNKELNAYRLELLKSDILSKKIDGSLPTEVLLKNEIINAEFLLGGVYKNFDKDPDYKLY